MGPLKSIEEHQEAVLAIHKLNQEHIQESGVACPNCGKEMIFPDNVILASYPPQRHVQCPDINCAHRTSIYY